MNELKAVSVIDGRYKNYTKELEDVFSEYGLIKHRVFVEINWLIFLLEDLKMEEVSKSQVESIKSVFKGFNVESAKNVKQIESTTNHDVKAVEYYIKQKLEQMKLGEFKELVHFGCTSEDINNLSYAMMLKKGKEILSRYLEDFHSHLIIFAKEWKTVPMMSKTHGQPASPTTVGKEFVNFAWRINKEIKNLKNAEIEGKMNGATGNFNAHFFAKPDIDWIRASQKFVSQKLEIQPLLWTTQINPYSYISEILHIISRISSILIDFDRDMWGYISFGYFRQKTVKGEIGSSTMPHKVNPINFENSEGNCGIVISLANHLAAKLLNSRFQRDLTDSSVLRNLGTIFGHLLIALKNTKKGMGKLEINENKIASDLNQNWELLAEPIQTVMRLYGEENPYEKLKELTRGKKISQKEIEEFLKTLSKVPDKEKEKIKNLSPKTYIGNAVKLVDLYLDSVE